MAARRAAIAAALIVIMAVATITAYRGYFAQPPSPCAPVKGGTSRVTTLRAATFGPVTEYPLPSSGRWPTAITAAPDGSVWFVEQEIPGVGHFFPGNGTLVEYAFPGYATPEAPGCAPQVSSSGIVFWNGRVWVADEFGNVILGVGPAGGKIISYSTASKAGSPYWLAVGPNGDLWFTSDEAPPRIGEISPSGTLSIIDLAGLGQDLPVQLEFVNSTLAFIATLDVSPLPNSNTCSCDGHIYSFDPSRVGPTVSPSLVGGDFHLVLPTSVAYSEGSVWVAQHGTSQVASYDFATREWTAWPTTTVPWSATYPYYVVADGGSVWFNEHYADKIATIDPANGTLTEYSESNPPASASGGIQNDEYIAQTQGRLWFTSLSGNYIGFVQEGYAPSFTVGASGNNTARLQRGGNAAFTLRVSGSWSSSLGVNVSDSEGYSSVPSAISVVPSTVTIPPGSSPFALGIAVNVSQSLAPGRYTVTVTLTDGGVQQAAFLFLLVT